MVDNKKQEIKIEIIENNDKNKENNTITMDKRRTSIPFKCPVCKKTIFFKFEIPKDCKIFPYTVNYPHFNHVLLIDIDNNNEIREIKIK